MNWQHIIDNGQLVYQSKENDVPFRNWSLKKTQCEISFYETYPLDDIDKIVCSILSNHNGTMEECEIATILGFNVKNDFDVTPRRYADDAELQLFRAIVNPVLVWGLISKSLSKEEPVTYSITELGKRAFEKNEKYKFYRGKKVLFENYGICATSADDSDFFPYFQEFNLCSEISNSCQISYENIDTSVFDIEESDLIKRMHLQSAIHYNIYQAKKTVYFEIESTQVDFRLLLYDNTYFLLIYLQDRFCPIATELLNNDANTKLKDKKIEWGLYLRLMNDENAILDYASISPFEDILDLSDLIPDKRLVWNDDVLFAFITENADGNQYTSISRHCPLEVIKKHIKDDLQWDWIVLSQRMDELFILNNHSLSWDYEIISTREISIPTIKSLLVIPELRNAEWNWDVLMSRLDLDSDFDFIKDNIRVVDFDLYELTRRNSDDVKTLICQNTNKRWDWSYISKEYELGFILDNIKTFAYEQDGNTYNHLNLRTIIDRAFVSTEFAEQYCTSAAFKDVLKDNTALLSNFSTNTSNYLWTPNMITLLEDVGLLIWESGLYTAGFECNPYLKWNKTFFNNYCHKIKTPQGYSAVSSMIDDPQIVIENSSFEWDWIRLSENNAVISNDDFVKAFIDKLSLRATLQNIRSGVLIEELFLNYNLVELLSEDTDSWQIVTQKVSVEFVRNNLNYNWDWEILTQRFYSTIKIKALGNERWVDKWDWHFLTRNLDWSIILQNLDGYCKYWDWTCLIDSRFDKSDLLFSTSLMTIAKCVSMLSDEEQTILWNKITRKLSYQELAENIHKTKQSDKSPSLFRWDYEYFYSMPEFDIYSYLENFLNDVQWDSLSKSSKLNDILKKDSTIYSEKRWVKNVKDFLENEDYLWDFKELSKLESINYHPGILAIRTQKWDWHYLTANSHIFDRSESFITYFYQFKKYIDFKSLSARKESGLSQNIIAKNIDARWDWIALSNNQSIRFDIKFIKEQSTKPWDWQALSARTDIKLDNDSLYDLIDKDWNWQAISSCQSVVFDETCIIHLLSKPLDWFAVSQNSSFLPNQKTLSLLKGEKLDWDAISSNTKLDKSVLWDYKNCLNWKNVTQNIVDCSDIQQLETFKDYVDWHFVSQCNDFNITSRNLLEFKSKLDWRAINQRKDFIITGETIELFADVLDWDRVSESQDIDFSERIVEKYRSKWNWRILRRNPSVIDRLHNVLENYVAEFNCADFVEKFSQQSAKPSIYHFTHLFNAIEVIRTRKIYSRNKAKELGLLKYEAAGSVVHNGSEKAYPYARFYYRPQTPTQFYNECLGWDSRLHTSWGKSYYPQALNLGLPKCPMPVFFKFDLDEVVSKMSDKCYYSTGNMQTNWASVKKVSDNPNGLNVDYVYSTIRDGIAIYKQYSQQEFLVLNEFDFSDLQSFEIICYNEEQADILRHQLDGDDIVDRITTDEYNAVFHRNNRKLNIWDNGDSLMISSDYQDDAHFVIKTTDKHIVNIDGTTVIKETADSILAYPNIKFAKADIPIEVKFIDEKNREWMVYKNSNQDEKPNIEESLVDNKHAPLFYFYNKNNELHNLYDSTVRHYTIKRHTELVCSAYEKYFKFEPLPIEKTLFRIFLAIHDIGKPLAEKIGNRQLQHTYTKELINKYDWSYYDFQVNDKMVLIALADNDCVGEYFQGKKEKEDAAKELSMMAQKTNISIKDFFYLFMVYYQCDVASYTQDEGGLPYLEYLFEYDKSHRKVFDSDEHLIKMSPVYWQKYHELKRCIYDSKY